MTTRTYEISFKMHVDSSDGEAFKRLEHHMEELIDFDSWPEIKDIWDARVHLIHIRHHESKDN